MAASASADAWSFTNTRSLFSTMRAMRYFAMGERVVVADAPTMATGVPFKRALVTVAASEISD
jgi:hypothetical protein